MTSDTYKNDIRASETSVVKLMNFLIYFMHFWMTSDTYENESGTSETSVVKLMFLILCIFLMTSDTQERHSCVLNFSCQIDIVFILLYAFFETLWVKQMYFFCWSNYENVSTFFIFTTKWKTLYGTSCTLFNYIFIYCISICYFFFL